MTAATLIHQHRVETPPVADGSTELPAGSTLSRWTSKRISAVEGSHLVLARYSQKSSASQDDEPAGLPLRFCESSLVGKSKGKGKGGPYSEGAYRRGAYLPFVGRWARRWINYYCLWRMASATPDLRLPSQPKLALIAHTRRGMARLSWPGWLLHTQIIYPPEDGHPARH